jgi:ribose transport system substrate-binding protein
MNRLKWAAPLAFLALATSACASSKDAGDTAAPSTDAASAGASAAAGGDLAEFQDLVQKYTAPVAWNGPTEAAKAPTGKKVGILSCSFALEGCRLPTEAIQAAVKKLGWTQKTVVVDEPSKYNGGMKSLLVDKPDAILATGINASLVGDAIKAAKAQGTLLISLIENNPVDPTNGYDADVTPDAKAVGEALGARMVVDAGGDLKLLNMNNQEFGYAKAITASMLATVAKCTKCKVVKDIKFTRRSTRCTCRSTRSLPWSLPT